MKIKISIDTKSKEDIVALRKLADLLESTSKPETTTTTIKGSDIVVPFAAEEDSPRGRVG